MSEDDSDNKEYFKTHIYRKEKKSEEGINTFSLAQFCYLYYSSLWHDTHH
jgi:hypothetical protein